MTVRIETLPPMRVASVLASGDTPELEAWRRLREWAAPKGLLDDPARHPIFGFNNPPPSPTRAGYGYELWIRVDAAEPAETAVAFKEFEGGLFAVTAARLAEVPAAWRALWDWVQASPYRWRQAQELEKPLNPEAPENELILELYLPVQAQAEALS